MAIKHRIHESDRLLPSRQTLLIDPINNGSENGSAGARSATEPELAFVVDGDVVSVRSDVRIAPSGAIVDADAVGVIVGFPVGRVRWLVVGEEGFDGFGLVLGLAVDVGEAAAGGECDAVWVACWVHDGRFGIEDGFARVDLGGTDVCEVWTAVGPGGAEDGSVLRGAAVLVQASVRTVIAWRACHAIVSRSVEYRNALQAELHEFIALTLLIVCWKVSLLPAIGYRDDISGLVDATLQLALITTRGVVGVGRVEDWVVACFAKGRVSAVGAVEGIEERVETSTCSSL